MQGNYVEYESSHNVHCDVKSGHCLYLGDIESALDLEFIKSKGIATVVTAASGMDHIHYQKHITHIVYSLLDSNTQNITHLFSEFYLLIQNAFKRGSVLVHCAAGISRSATLVLSYLMKYSNWTFKQAIQNVRKIRSNILPNLGFERQLKSYEQYLNSLASQPKQEEENQMKNRQEQVKTSEPSNMYQEHQSKMEQKLIEFSSLIASDPHPSAGIVNISFYNKNSLMNQKNFSSNLAQRHAQDSKQARRNEPKLSFHQDNFRERRSELKTDLIKNINFRLRGIKQSYSEIKKKETSISHRGKPRIIESRNFTEKGIRNHQKIDFTGNLNNFEVIKINISKKHVPDKLAFGKLLKGSSQMMI